MTSALLPFRRSRSTNVACVTLFWMVLTLCILSGAARADGLISWWPGNGNFKDVVSGNNGTRFGSVSFGASPFGQAFRFDGATGRIFVPDADNLKLTGSLTLSAWIYLSAYPHTSLGGQILFRGDDRDGLDPYALTVAPDGSLGFHVANNLDSALEVVSPTPLPLHKWLFVAATLDDSTNWIRLYVDGTPVARVATNLRPFADLDPHFSPGIGIGNTQSGNYTEYFAGNIANIKIYNVAIPVVHPSRLNVSPATIKGGSKTQVYLYLDDTTVVPTTVKVQSSSAMAEVPASVVLPAGFSHNAFTVATSPVTTKQTVTVTATYNGVTVQTKLTLTP